MAFWKKFYKSKYTGAEIDAAIAKAGDATKVTANPTLAGTESALTGLEVGTTKYKVEQPINVVANPTLAGTESALEGLQVGDTKYKVGGGGGSLIKATPVTIDYEGTDYNYDIVWDLHVTVGGNASTINVVFVTPADYAKILNREADCVIFNHADPTFGDPPIYDTAFVESVDPTDVVLGVGAANSYYLRTQATVKFIQAEHRFYDVYNSTFASNVVYIAPNTLDVAYETK